MRSAAAAAAGPPADAASARLSDAAHQTAHNQPGETLLSVRNGAAASLENPSVASVASGTRKGARSNLEPSKAESRVTVALCYFTSKTEID